jgi:hypothetical protein
VTVDDSVEGQCRPWSGMSDESGSDDENDADESAAGGDGEGQAEAGSAPKYQGFRLTDISARDAVLAQKLGQPQPFLAVFPHEMHGPSCVFWVNLTPLSP